MPQAQSTAFPRHQKKNEMTNKKEIKQHATYKAADIQTRIHCNKGTTLERSVEKLLGVGSLN